MSTGFKTYTASEVFVETKISTQDILDIAAAIPRLQGKTRFNEDEKQAIVSFARQAKENGMTIRQAIAALQQSAEPQPRSTTQTYGGATAGTPGEAIETIKKGMAPVMQGLVNQHSSLIAQRDQFVDDLVDSTIAEIAITPVLFGQKLQKRVQEKKQEFAQANATPLNLSLIENELFTLPSSSAGRQAAQRLLSHAANQRQIQGS